MQIKLCLFVVAAATLANALPVEEARKYSRFVEVPGGDGQMHQVDLEEQPDLELLSEIARNPANNRYLLFTRRNPEVAHELIMNDPSTLWNSPFEAWKPTMFIVHGWLSNQNTDLNPVIREAYLNKVDGNVIVLDWRRLALSGYVTAVSGVPAIGRGLGQFIEYLQSNTGASSSQIHLVGFSLGAHVVGNAGRELKGKIARVTGLDPAGPLWNYNSNRLSSTDGVYVEGIHTNGGLVGLGIGSAIAKVDFFVNGGNSQPGCLTPICDHNRAWEFFAATITYNHLIGNECSSSLQISLNRCSGQELAMGNEILTKTGSGQYRVNTARRYPF